MLNTTLDRYDFLGQIMGQDFETFVDDTVSARWDIPQWKTLFAWDTMQMSDVFNVVEANIGLRPMATIIDTYAPKPKRAIQGMSLYSGQIPKMGHGFDLGEKDLREWYVTLQNGGQIPEGIMMSKMTDIIDMLEFGAHARLNSMCFQAFSKGHVIIDTSNNPGGLAGMDIDLRVPTVNKKYAGFSNGEAATWTDPTATPLTDLADLVQYAIDNYISADVLYFPKVLWTRFKTHPNVIKDVTSFYNNTNVATVNIVAETQLRNYMSELGLPAIKLIDEASGLDTDGVIANIKSWDESNIVLAKSGQIGRIKNAVPISVNDPAARQAFTESGRIKLLQTFDAKRNVQGFEMECLAFPVLPMAKNHIIMDTSTTSQWT